MAPQDTVTWQNIAVSSAVKNLFWTSVWPEGELVQHSFCAPPPGMQYGPSHNLSADLPSPTQMESPSLLFFSFFNSISVSDEDGDKMLLNGAE